MRRADRLFQLVQLLRRDRATTAARLAVELEVSERTVYRCVRDLVLAGVPIQGEAGVGYALPRHFDLPPLMFTAAELQALSLGARMVESWADDELARAARTALRKVEHAVPAERARSLQDSRLFAPAFHIPRTQRGPLQVLRQAVERRCVVRLRYANEAGAASERAVRPLGLFYWGRTWTLVAWCELRADFRSFRLDRIGEATATARTFADEPGRTLDDFVQRVAAADPSAGGGPDEPSPPARRGGTSRGKSLGGAPKDPAERAAWREFQRLGSVGPATAADLLQLGFRRIDDLRGQDPIALYERLCALTGRRQDPCVEDTLRCAIARAEQPELPERWRQWHRWTALRGRPAGSLPDELRAPGQDPQTGLSAASRGAARSPQTASPRRRRARR
jgi:predicted DNA-binding transcriptional regulator YafY